MLKQKKQDWLSRNLGLNIRRSPQLVLYLLYVALTLWMILLLTIYL